MLSLGAISLNPSICPISGCHNLAETSLLLQSPNYKCLEMCTDFGQLVCGIAKDYIDDNTVCIGKSAQHSLGMSYEAPFLWSEQVCNPLKTSK